MGCSNSKSANDDNFEFVSNTRGDNNASTQQTSSRNSQPQEKVYRNYSDKIEQKADSPDDFSDSDTDIFEGHVDRTEGRYSSGSTSDEQEPPVVLAAVKKVEVLPTVGKSNKSEAVKKVEVLPTVGKSNKSDELTSDEDINSPSSSPMQTPNDSRDHKPQRGNGNGNGNDHLRRGATSTPTAAQNEDFMTPVVMGHHHNAVHRKSPKASAVQFATPVSASKQLKEKEKKAKEKAKEKAKDDIPPASVETQLKAIVRMQKLFRQRKHWKHVVEEREWKVRGCLHVIIVYMCTAVSQSLIRGRGGCFIMFTVSCSLCLRFIHYADLQ